MNLEKQFRPLTYQLCWTEDVAAMHAWHNYNNTINFKYSNFELIFISIIVIIIIISVIITLTIILGPVSVSH